ncbi:putative ankyrin repeat domain-containing protein 19 [Antechinus flavipes]|uniref:putative ankyrin repeat domain-containing protein 19 n=1 Tax=Antechinus flavipes TaxID=38775 RepID=UPI002236469A|nr:putative ankyrin repeat domain-containing protein 19 [Antechinus flavipes]
MKKIFDFGKKKQVPPFPDLMLPDYFGVQKSFYVPGYVIQSKDLGEIHHAALLGDVDKVQHLLLIKKNGVNDVDRKKRTCLHLACCNGHPAVVSLLIERKCDLNLLDRDGRTPFMKAIQCEEEDCATILLQHGADPNIGDGSNNALHYVSFFLGIGLAAKLLHYKADIEAKNKEGLTPLFFAVRRQNCNMAEFLLKNGANVNALDGSKRTTLMIAASMRSTEMVSLLLKYNADHTIKDPLGYTAEEYAKINNYPLVNLAFIVAYYNDCLENTLVNASHLENCHMLQENGQPLADRPLPVSYLRIHKNFLHMIFILIDVDLLCFVFYFRDVYVKQIEKHMERNKPCTPQISCSEKATVVPEFVSRTSSLDKKGRTNQFK